MAVIFYVDDESRDLKTYSRALEREGYEVRRFSDGSSMLSQLETTLPDLIVLDIEMPRMDGLEVLRRVLDNDNGIPVILHTAYPEYQDSYLSWNVDAYVIKQGGGEELCLAVEEVLAR